MEWDQIGALDAVLGAWLLWAMFHGFRKGFIIKIASIIALVLGVFAGFHFSGYAAEWLNAEFNWSTRTTEVGAFAVTFLAVVMGVHLLAKVLEKIVDLTALSLVNKLGGMLLGLVQSLFFLSALTYMLDGVFGPRKWLPDAQVEQSVLYPHVESAIEYVVPGMQRSTPWGELRDRIEAGLDELEDATLELRGEGERN
jgi:membrane protein required for colicin V production